MRYLLFGDGNAREHATFLALRRGLPSGDRVVFALSGRNGLLVGGLDAVSVADLDGAIQLAREFQPDLVLVLSPVQMIAGVPEAFEAEGFVTFGVSRAASRLEADKAYAKCFLLRNRIPTPEATLVTSFDAGRQFLKENWVTGRREYVLKATRFVMDAFERTAVPRELDEALVELGRLAGLPGGCTESNPILIEHKLTGWELSLHLLTDGCGALYLPPVKDYKRLLDGDAGPMTHGMAAVARGRPLSAGLLQRIDREVVAPTLEGLRRDGIAYRHVLYIGLMIVDDEPFVLEYNTRSGNPEWLALLGLINTPIGPILDATARGRLVGVKPFWDEAICVAAFGVAAGYPVARRARYPETIEGLDDLSGGLDVIGDAIARDGATLHPSGGRVFALRATDASVEVANRRIESGFALVRMRGLYYRRDLDGIFEPQELSSPANG